MKTKILAVALSAAVLAGCANQTQNATNTASQSTGMSQSIQTLTLSQPITIAAIDTPKGDLLLEKISVNKISRDTTFSFKQVAPGRQAFDVSLRPTDGDPCIRNMAALSKRVATLLNGSTLTDAKDKDPYLCVAVVTALKNDGEVTRFLKDTTSVVCR